MRCVSPLLPLLLLSAATARAQNAVYPEVERSLVRAGQANDAVPSWCQVGLRVELNFVSNSLNRLIPPDRSELIRRLDEIESYVHGSCDAPTIVAVTPHLAAARASAVRLRSHSIRHGSMSERVPASLSVPRTTVAVVGSWRDGLLDIALHDVALAGTDCGGVSWSVNVRPITGQWSGWSTPTPYGLIAYPGGVRVSLLSSRVRVRVRPAPGYVDDRYELVLVALSTATGEELARSVSTVQGVGSGWYGGGRRWRWSQFEALASRSNAGELGFEPR